MYHKWDALKARMRALPNKCSNIISDLIKEQQRLLGLSGLKKAIIKIENMPLGSDSIVYVPGEYKTDIQAVADYFFPSKGKKGKKINSNVKCICTFHKNVIMNNLQFKCKK